MSDKEQKVVKIFLKNEEIDFFVVSLQDGRILESGDENPDTWEDTYLEVASIEVGKKPKISYTKGYYMRKNPDKKVTWQELNYIVTGIEKLNFKNKNGESIKTDR